VRPSELGQAVKPTVAQLGSGFSASCARASAHVCEIVQHDDAGSCFEDERCFDVGFEGITVNGAIDDESRHQSRCAGY
jgi:hypothetical protein